MTLFIYILVLCVITLRVMDVMHAEHTLKQYSIVVDVDKNPDGTQFTYKDLKIAY